MASMAPMQQYAMAMSNRRLQQQMGQTAMGGGDPAMMGGADPAAMMAQEVAAKQAKRTVVGKGRKGKRKK